MLLDPFCLHLLLAGHEEDMAVNSVPGVGLRVAGNHRKQTLLSLGRAQHDAVQGMSHDQLGWGRGGTIDDGNTCLCSHLTFPSPPPHPAI